MTVMTRLSVFSLINLIGLLFSLTLPAHAADVSGLSEDDRNNIQIACALQRSNGPVAYNRCVQRQLADLRSSEPSGHAEVGIAAPVEQQSVPAASSLAPAVPGSAYPAGTAVQPNLTPACAENGSCYGDISTITGLPKTVHVDGYFRSDGKYVRGYYRSHR